MIRSRLTADDDPTEDETCVTEQEMFTTLSNARRLSVLRYLVDVDESTDLGTLVEAVAVEEFDVTADELDRKQERRVYVALHQNHLPYLEEKGLVEWDRGHGVVSLRDAGTVERYLRTTDSPPARSYRSPIVLSTCSLGLVAGYQTELVGGVGLSALGVLTLVAAASLLAAATTWTAERSL